MQEILQLQLRFQSIPAAGKPEISTGHRLRDINMIYKFFKRIYTYIWLCLFKDKVIKTTLLHQGQGGDLLADEYVSGIVLYRFEANEELAKFCESYVPKGKEYLWPPPPEL